MVSEPQKLNASERKAKAMEMCSSGQVKMIDFKFTDVPGTLQHISYPSGRMCEDLLKDGVGFDASSIRGFAHINESDMSTGEQKLVPLDGLVSAIKCD